MKKAAGILLPLFSLPSAEGRGCLDHNAYKFIDWLVECKQSYWQLLPIGPTLRYANPYSAFSSFGGDSAFVSLEKLEEQGIIHTDKPFVAPANLSLNELRSEKEQFILNNITQAIENYAGFSTFIENNKEWLDDYAAFSYLTYEYGRPWTAWPTEYRNYSAQLIDSLQERPEVMQRKFFQWLFATQWNQLKEYAHSKGIKLIGDIPIYVDHHSIDLWPAAHLFKLEKDGTPQFVSGAPPDQFSDAGQVWNTPIFNWPKHQQENFKWWRKRIAHIFSLFDIVRIDHFRGLEAYWEIPYKEEPDAREGKWVNAPGRDLFTQLLQDHQYPLIIEDLGDIDDKVRNLRDDFNFPGMKILQFAFDTDHSNEYLPHHIPENAIVYTGTHDNDTTKGWLQQTNSKQQANLKKECQIEQNDRAVWQLIDVALHSKACTAIIPMGDILELGSEGRINVPGLAKGNWSWRFDWEQLKPEQTKKLRELTETTGR